MSIKEVYQKECTYMRNDLSFESNWCKRIFWY